MSDGWVTPMIRRVQSTNIHDSNTGSLAPKANMMTITPPSHLRHTSRRHKKVWQLLHGRFQPWIEMLSLTIYSPSKSRKCEIHVGIRIYARCDVNFIKFLPKAFTLKINSAMVCCLRLVDMLNSSVVTGSAKSKLIILPGQMLTQFFGFNDADKATIKEKLEGKKRCRIQLQETKESSILFQSITC